MLEMVDFNAESVESVLARVPAAILIADSDGRYTFANDAACDLLGRSQAEILCRSIRDVTADPIEAEIAWREFVSLRRAEGEFTVLRPDGVTVPVAFSAVCEFAPGRHISVPHDLSERRRIERLIKRDEELFNRAFRASPAPTNIRRLDSGQLIDVNQAFTDATGYTRSDVIGRTASSIGFWKDISKLNEMMDRLRAGENVVQARTRVVARDGAEREFHVALKRFDIDGESLVIAVYTDLSAL
ncbi:MAG: PAS domain-containing protein [Dehalococcoidia bacterium]